MNELKLLQRRSTSKLGMKKNAVKKDPPATLPK
jgi:hypothetical protein